MFFPDVFGNTKQVIQDYDAVFDNWNPFRKNNLPRITYFRIPGVPGLQTRNGFP
jgi:hypothetical protein